MLREARQPGAGADVARREVPGDRVQTVPGHQTPVSLRHHRHLGRLRFLGDQLSLSWANWYPDAIARLWPVWDLFGPQPGDRRCGVGWRHSSP
jgi:hypothetical protein